MIFCDPPFTKVSLSQLFAALRVLCDGDFATPVLVCHLASREADVCGALALFDLRATGFEPGYVSVRPIEENRVMLYANVDPARVSAAQPASSSSFFTTGGGSTGRAVTL